jgi:hypothetical protein
MHRSDGPPLALETMTRMGMVGNVAASAFAMTGHIIRMARKDNGRNTGLGARNSISAFPFFYCRPPQDEKRADSLSLKEWYAGKKMDQD